MSKEVKVLVITPALTGGSWRSIRNVLEYLQDKSRIRVFSVGSKLPAKNAFTVITLPYPTYERNAQYVERKLWSSMLYFLPLYFFSFCLAIIYRPRIIIANGLTSTFPFLITKSLTKIRVILAFHSYFKVRLEGFNRIIPRILSNVDLALANSVGSQKNLALIVPESKICILEHVADNIFFQRMDRSITRRKYGFGEKYVILYVGRTDTEKRCDKLISLCELFQNRNEVMFVFVGEGSLTPVLQRLQNTQKNVRYFGYISDKVILHELYTSADLTWSYADETYLAIPAVESLASGTPIIIPATPAVEGKQDGSFMVDPALVPPEIGWLITDESPEKLAQMINQIISRPNNEMRLNCQKYARDRYGNGQAIKNAANSILCID